MTNHRLFLWIGGALIVLPFLGIPESWKHLIMFIIALALIAIALIIRSNEQSEGVPADEPVFEDADAPHAHTATSAHSTHRSSHVPSDTDKHDEEVIDVAHPHEPVYEFSVFEETLEYEVPTHDTVSQHTQVVEDVIPPKPKKPRKKRVAKESASVTSDIQETFDEYVR